MVRAAFRKAARVWGAFPSGAAGVLAAGPIADVVQAVASRPEEFHPRPLTERCGNLSAHTAPTKQPDGIRAVQ